VQIVARMYEKPPAVIQAALDSVHDVEVKTAECGICAEERTTYQLRGNPADQR